MKEITTCRCCKGENLLLYLNLGNQPLANSYHKDENLPTYPLHVLLCKNCFHSQLSIVVNPDVMFRNYLYVSGTTKTFRNHCQQLARDAVRRIPKKHLSVLDIACNDGTQLEFFQNLDCHVQGVDPAENLRDITKAKNIPVVVDYWTRKIAKKLQRKYDIITGTNVFAHVDNLDEFLEGVKIALNSKGILILEFPYAQNMITHNEFDTIYHEHLSYFLVNSFKSLMDRKGFYIEEVLQTPIHGGSIRFFVKVGSKKHTPKVDILIKKERKKGLYTVKTYKDFSYRVKENKNEMKRLLQRLKQMKYKVVGYGASAKGNTMLNYFNIFLDYIVDDNPLKWGYYTPGESIYIESPKKLKAENNKLCVLILSWNFTNEIIKNIIKLRSTNRGDRYIAYVPDVQIFPIKKSTIFAHSA